MTRIRRIDQAGTIRSWLRSTLARSYPTNARPVLMSTAVPATSSRIPGYGLDAPTEDAAIAALQRVFGAERATSLWSDACRQAGLLPGRVAGTESLVRASEALGSQGGAVATVARSITIRLRTHARLAALRATTPSGDGR